MTRTLTHEEARQIASYYNTGWAKFRPRIDRPEEFDQQSGYVNSRDLVSFCLGGNACLIGSTLIYDPIAKKYRQLDQIDGPFYVWSLNPESHKREIGISCQPFCKGTEELYEIELSNGEKFTSTLGHRVLTKEGYWSVGDLLQCDDAHRPSIVGTCLSGLPRDACHSFHKSKDFQENYSPDFRQYDVSPLWEAMAVLATFRQLSDALVCNHAHWRKNDPGILREYNPIYQQFARPSSNHCEHQEHQSDALHSLTEVEHAEHFYQLPEHQNHDFLTTAPAIHRHLTERQFPCTTFHQLHTTESFHQSANQCESLEKLHKEETETHYHRIVSIQYFGREKYWDITVFPHNNYEVAGVFHANSGKTSASAFKCAQFVLNTPPPRKNTPFWIVGATYKQVCAVCWSEKLHGEKFIPDCEIDFRNISWYKPRMGWPAMVPLKPWPNGNNWCLEFMSYEQGREAMQARSIAGMWFSEQFKWEIFLEVLRGCREYMYPGGQFAEFTPIDPELCIAIENVMDDPPNGWNFYRLNTEQNRPNLAKDWYDQFFAAVPDEMIATRKTGALATFEGVIYQSFNPLVHVTNDDSMAWLPGTRHHRAFDWGASAEHPQTAVWGCYDAIGNWLIYDEYWCNSQDKITQDHAVEILSRSIAWGWPKPDFFIKPEPNQIHFVNIVNKRVAELIAGMNGSRSKYNVNLYRTYGDSYADPSRPGEINAFNYWGIPTYPAANNFDMGMDYVRSLLKINPVTGQPRLKIHSRCKHLIEEKRKYRWAKRKQNSGLGVTGVAPPRPLKKDDDTVDGERYLLFSEFRSRGIEPTSTKVNNNSRGDVLLERGGRLQSEASRGYFKR